MRVLLFLCLVTAPLCLAQNPTVSVTECAANGKDCLEDVKMNGGVEVVKGKQIRLVCAGEGEPGPIRVSWRLKNVPAAAARSADSILETTVVQDVTLVCTATDGNGRTAETEVDIRAVEETVPPLSVSLTECVTETDGGSCLGAGPTEVDLGTVVRMVCRSQGGTPPVILNWMVEGKRALKTEAARDGIKELTVTIATDTTFICTGMDAEGKEASLSKTFRIKPQVGEFLAINIIEPIPEAGKRLERTLGEVVTVVCEGRGAPRLPTDLTFNFPAGGEAPEVVKSVTARSIKLEAQWTVIAGTQVIDCKGSNGNLLGTVTSRMTIVGVGNGK